jgi:molybdopterin molybdotransferase
MSFFRRSKKTSAPPVEVEETVVVPPPTPRSVTEQAKLVLAATRPLRPFGMHLMDTYGLTLCEDIVADLDLPGHAQSAIEGYGVRSSDVTVASAVRPIHLGVVDDIAPDDPAGPAVTIRAAVKVAVGASLPDGIDAVIAVADVLIDADGIVVSQPAPPGLHVMQRGSEVSEGEVLVRSGRRIDARTIGVLAESGHDKILVRPRPRVVVMTIGRHLVAPGMPLSSRVERYDATTAMIAAAARADGAQCYAVGALPEDAERIRQVLSDQLIRADLVITVGGLDPETPVLKQAVDGIGVADFAPVDMAPSNEQGFATIGEDHTPVLMLPGAPVSAFVVYQTLVHPVLRSMAGHKVYDALTKRLTASVPIVNDTGRTLYLPAKTEGDKVTPLRGFSLASRLADVDVLVVVPASLARVEAGEQATCWLLDT